MQLVGQKAANSVFVVPDSNVSFMALPANIQTAAITPPPL